MSSENSGYESFPAPTFENQSSFKTLFSLKNKPAHTSIPPTAEIILVQELLKNANEFLALIQKEFPHQNLRLPKAIQDVEDQLKSPSFIYNKANIARLQLEFLKFVIDQTSKVIAQKIQVINPTAENQTSTTLTEFDKLAQSKTNVDSAKTLTSFNAEFSENRRKEAGLTKFKTQLKSLSEEIETNLKTEVSSELYSHHLTSFKTAHKEAKNCLAIHRNPVLQWLTKYINISAHSEKLMNAVVKKASIR